MLLQEQSLRGEVYFYSQYPSMLFCGYWSSQRADLKWQNAMIPALSLGHRDYVCGPKFGTHVIFRVLSLILEGNSKK